MLESLGAAVHLKHETHMNAKGFCLILFAMFCTSAVIYTSQVQAQSSQGSGTGLPVPRFVSLKSAKVNMRIGPGKQFQVVWRYVKKGLPVEIIQEYDNWRKVRDPEGDEGWILHSLLSGKRTIIVNPGDKGNADAIAPLYANPAPEERQIARIEPGVVAQVLACQKEWCQISTDSAEGYVEKKLLWGVYPDELIEP